MNAPNPTLRIHYPTRRYVLSASRSDSGALELFAPTHARHRVGTVLLLVVDFGDTSQRFELNGRVSYVRGGSYGISAEPGLGLTFEGDQKKAASEMLAFCAGKPLSQGTAGRKRVPTHIRCRFVAGSQAVSGEVLDLSSSGLFVNLPSKLPGLKTGASLQLRLNPGLFGLGGRRLVVRVMWQGEKQGVYGFGGRFLDEPFQVNAKLRKFLG